MVLYLFNLYPITNWPFRLNPSPCPWPFPIDGYKKRVMLGFWLSLNTWWRCRCGRWSCGTSSGRSQSQCARLPPALLAQARRGSAAGGEHGGQVCLRRHWQGARCQDKRKTYEFVEEFCGALHRHTSSHGNCFHRAITLHILFLLFVSVFCMFVLSSCPWQFCIFCLLCFEIIHLDKEPMMHVQLFKLALLAKGRGTVKKGDYVRFLREAIV